MCPRGRSGASGWLGLASHAQGRGRARRIPRTPRRQHALEHDHGVRAETQMRDAHRFDGGGDRARIGQLNVLAHSSERDVGAERLGVEWDLAAGELGAYPLADGQQRGSTGTDPDPDHPGSTGRRKAACPVQLDIERGHGRGGCLNGRGNVSELLVGRSAEERERDVHELGLHTAQRREVRRAAERRLGDLGGEWQRDEESYPRRLEPRGVRLVSDKQGDEGHSEKTTEASECCDPEPFAAADALPCVGDLREQGTHCDTRLSKQRAACCY